MKLDDFTEVEAIPVQYFRCPISGHEYGSKNRLEELLKREKEFQEEFKDVKEGDFVKVLGFDDETVNILRVKEISFSEVRRCGERLVLICTNLSTGERCTPNAGSSIKKATSEEHDQFMREQKS